MLELESELILDPPRPNSLTVLFYIALVLFWSDYLDLRWIGNLLRVLMIILRVHARILDRLDPRSLDRRENLGRLLLVPLKVLVD